VDTIRNSFVVDFDGTETGDVLSVSIQPKQVEIKVGTDLANTVRTSKNVTVYQRDRKGKKTGTVFVLGFPLDSVWTLSCDFDADSELLLTPILRRELASVKIEHREWMNEREPVDPSMPSLKSEEEVNAINNRKRNEVSSSFGGTATLSTEGLIELDDTGDISGPGSNISDTPNLLGGTRARG